MIPVVILYIVVLCTVVVRAYALGTTPKVKSDIILSSGFLAFARQAGFLEALEDHNIEVNRIVGTSSGALAGAMLAAGYSADEIALELSRRRPIQLFSPSRRVHKGLFSLKGLRNHLGTLLPKDFKDLIYPLALGVYETSTGKFQLVTDGDLRAAVAASCAIPYVFQPVLAGSPPRFMADGGVKDRTGLSAWANWAPPPTGSELSAAEVISVKEAVEEGTDNGKGLDTSVSESMKEGEDTGSGTKTEVGDNSKFHDTNKETPDEHKRSSKVIVHLVDSTAKKGATPASEMALPYTSDPTLVTPDETDLFVIRTPRSKANFFSLKDFDAQRKIAYACAAKGFATPDFADFCREEL